MSPSTPALSPGKAGFAEKRIVTYCPLPYNGRGPAESCVRLLERPQSESAQDILIIPRVRKSLPGTFRVEPAFAHPFNFLPWRLLERRSPTELRRALFRVLDTLDPADTILHFWPSTPLETVSTVRERGFIAVREMINCFRGTAKRILDDAYDGLDIPRNHPIDTESVALERAELALYNYVFASNAEVEKSLVEAGVDPARILPTSFGWAPSKYKFNISERPDRPVTALFVGSVGVRKGVPFLLRAWDEGGIDGQLILAGNVEEALKPLVEKYSNHSNIKFVDYVPDLSELYSLADFFVFPTLEEGGPQVVYEAAGAGLPVITTPMGAGRIINHQQNGLIVPPAESWGLQVAMRELAADRAKRLTFGRQAAEDSLEYTYERISLRRRAQMLDLLSRP